MSVLQALTAHGSALLFYLFAAIAVGGALGVVTQRNPMYAALSLLSTFLAVAALFLLRHAEFVAMVQVFVYGGGIMVLFLFVIMLVNLHRLEEERRYVAQLPAVVVLALLLMGLAGWLLARAPLGEPFAGPASFTTTAGLGAVGGHAGNSEAVAWALFQRHLLPFEIASLFLLVAMVGAVVLGRRR
jgi:NADH-quinone oxidoreductase subunit J